MVTSLDKLNLVLKLKKLMFDLKSYKKLVSETKDEETLKAAKREMDQTLRDTGFSIDVQDPKAIEGLIHEILPYMKDISQLSDEQSNQVDSVITSVSENISDFAKSDKVIDSPVEAFSLASRMIPNDFQLGEVDLGKAAETFRYICDQPNDFTKRVLKDIKKHDNTGIVDSLSDS